MALAMIRSVPLRTPGCIVDLSWARAASTEICAYQTSSVFIPAKARIAVRYSASAASTTARRSALANPLARPATSRLAASRLTSHSHGPGAVSSKSFRSKTSWRSGDAKTPKLDRCASPHSCTRSPDDGVPARSDAMTRAAPRKNAKGEDTIRPYRMGSRSGTRSAP